MRLPNVTRKPTILVVDDTPSNLSVINDLLKDIYQVKIATCGMRALEIARATPPDLMLLDVLMPDIDGYALCRELKSHAATRAIPIIFLTARADPADEERGLMLGAVDYITKPISAPVVLARIQTQMQLQAYSERLQQLVQMHSAERDHAQDHYARIQAATLTLGRQPTYRSMLDAALHGSVDLLQCDSGALFLRTHHNTLQLVVQIPASGPLHTEIRLTDSGTGQLNLLDACSRSLHLRSTVLLDNVTQDTNVHRLTAPHIPPFASNNHYKTVSMLVVPVAPRSGVVHAVLYFENLLETPTDKPFDARSVPYIEDFAAQIGAALDRYPEQLSQEIAVPAIPTILP